MPEFYRCSSFKGTYTQLMLPLFGVFLALISAFISIVIFKANLLLTCAIAFPLIIGLMVIFSNHLLKYSSNSFEMDGSELKFFNKNGQLKFSIPYKEIKSLQSVPFFSFDDLNNKIEIHLKSGDLYSILMNDDTSNILVNQFKSVDQPLDVKSEKIIPMYMHIMFGASILLLLLLGYIGIVYKDLFDVRLYFYALIIGSFIMFYLNKRRKLKKS